MGFLQKRRILGFPIIQITRGKGPVLIGSLSVPISLDRFNLCPRLAGPTRTGSACTVDEGNSGSPRSCSPLFPLFFLWGQGSLIPSDSSGRGSSPRGNLQRRRGIWRGPNFRLQVNQVLVRGFLQDRFWALILLGFLWGSGGFHNQGLYIRRIREFVNKKF